MNFYSRFVGDYMRDTTHLSLVEHGAFTVLLDTYYATEQPLPVDHEALYRICRAISPAEKMAVRMVADAFFPVAEDGKRHNKRADQEIIDARHRIEQAQNNGRQGGRPRKTGTETEGLSGTVTGNGTGGHAGVEPSREALHTHTHTQSKTKSKTKTSVAGPAVPLPEWLPKEAWDRYVEHRRFKRAPMSEDAAKLTVRNLEKLRAAGDDPVAVIDQSIQQGWTGVFQLRDKNRSAAPGTPKSYGQTGKL